MRPFVPQLCPIVAVLLPNVGNAQVYPHRTATPEVNAATADWQLNSEPIFVAARCFKRHAPPDVRWQVMVQVGVYEACRYTPTSRSSRTAWSTCPLRAISCASTSGAATAISRPPSAAVRRRSRCEIVRSARPGQSRQVSPAGGHGVGTNRPARAVVTRRLAVSAGAAHGGVWIEFQGGRWHERAAKRVARLRRIDARGEYQASGRPRSYAGRTRSTCRPVSRLRLSTSRQRWARRPRTIG